MDICTEPALQRIRFLYYQVTDDEGHDETQVITLTIDPVNDAGSFSGDTSGTGAEDAEDDITGTLTFTDAIDGDTAPEPTPSYQQHPMALHPIELVWTFTEPTLQRLRFLYCEGY